MRRSTRCWDSRAALDVWIAQAGSGIIVQWVVRDKVFVLAKNLPIKNHYWRGQAPTLSSEINTIWRHDNNIYLSDFLEEHVVGDLA